MESLKSELRALQESQSQGSATQLLQILVNKEMPMIDTLDGRFAHLFPGASLFDVIKMKAPRSRLEDLKTVVNFLDGKAKSYPLTSSNLPAFIARELKSAKVTLSLEQSTFLYCALCAGYSQQAVSILLLCTSRTAQLYQFAMLGYTSYDSNLTEAQFEDILAGRGGITEVNWFTQNFAIASKHQKQEQKRPQEKSQDQGNNKDQGNAGRGGGNPRH
eukprot:GILJ01028251.1.p1 GENE.GILJ01028251.1~~GILJ01028251.1.p1  ORF type:complete len:238 (-),score=29.99 GILJ01028251.1:1125-1775(-)